MDVSKLAEDRAREAALLAAISRLSNELVRHYQSLAYNIAYRIVNDPDAAADATQDAFLSAYRALDSFRGGSFKARLLRIVTNACYDELRRRKRRPTSWLDALLIGAGRPRCPDGAHREPRIVYPTEGPRMNHLPGGLAGFLLLHFPLLFLVLYGLVLIDRGVFASQVLSLLLSLAGIFAFSIHTYFIRRGREEFKAPVSQFILWSTLLVSLAQLGVTLAILTTS